MNIAKFIAHSSLPLLLAATICGAAPRNGGATFTTVVTYSASTRSSGPSRVFHSPHGDAYRFRLDPVRDINSNVLGFELVMERANRPGSGANLFDPTGMVHGYQKWDFLAAEFAPGHAPSWSYGDARTMDLSNLGLKVQAKVMQFAVEPTQAKRGLPAGYRFTRLTLEVVTRNTSL